MNIADYLFEETISVDLDVSNKSELLEAMIESIMISPSLTGFEFLTKDVVREGILNREKQASTGLGEGYGFPHARFKGLTTIITCLAVLKQPIDFDSFDKEPVDVVCMILAPEENPTLALKYMSELVKVFSNENTGEELRSLKSPAKIVTIFKGHEAHLDRAITAKDIMRPRFTTINQTSPLADVTQVMSEYRIQSAAVTDKNDKLVGEITCDTLFNYGVPDFFKSLKSVSFIAEFDPFERYFAEDKTCTAQDVMSSNYSAMNQDATIIEIVFALTVKKFPKVYVIDDNQVLLGIIDQSTVLDRIINI